MIKKLLRAVFIFGLIAGGSSTEAFSQSAGNVSFPVEIQVEVNGSGFNAFNAPLFRSRFVESLEKRTIYNLHAAEEGERAAVKLILTLADFELLEPQEQNTIKMVSRRIQVGIDKDGKAIYETRSVPENVVSYRVQASVKLGAAVKKGDSLAQVIGPGNHRRYHKNAMFAEASRPESITTESIVLALMRPQDWLLLRNEGMGCLSDPKA